MNFNRYLGLDIGTKRIGIAISDPLLITAQPLMTINRNPVEESVEKIKILCEEYKVCAIIVGLPKNMDGSLGPQSEDVCFYASLLRDKTGLEIIYEDERLTSKQAERILIEQKRKPSREKSLIDLAAAALILQQFLDKRSKK